MNKTLLPCLAATLLMVSRADAQTSFDDFTPLAGSAGPIPVGAEATPLTLSSPNFVQASIADRATQNTLSPGSNSGTWDMIASNETGADAGRYLFMPFETTTAGIQRIDLQDSNYNTRTVTIVAPGTQNFFAGDGSRWTPWGGYVTGEESWATSGSPSMRGRFFELTNPTTAAANSGSFVQRSIIPHVAFEGMIFDANRNFYFVDDTAGGSIYKYVSQNPTAATGDSYFAAGQTFALKVGAGGQNEGNGAAVTGTATWEPITNTVGGAISGTSILAADGFIDGRSTADHANVLATGFNRPEDIDLQTLGGGGQLLYFAVTAPTNNGGSGRVYHLNLATGEVALFADAGTIDLATGLALGAAFQNPDNLAIDAEGNVYIVEDRPGGVDGDIWFARDLNKDGDLLDPGEGLGRWASNGVQGTELSGLYFDKFDPNRAFVNVQSSSGANDRTVMITVPEPGASSLCIMAAGLLAVRRQRRA